MKRNILIRMVMAVVILFGAQTTAFAQLGGLLNKAKKTVKSTVERKAEPATQSNTSTSTTATTATTAEKPKLIELTNYYISFNEGVKTDWDYNSNPKDIESDMKYWLHRLRTSVELGVPATIDKEALERLAYGAPDFEFVNEKWHRWGGSVYGSKKLDAAKVEAIEYAYKILNGTTTPWDPMGDTDEHKAKKQEELFKMKKAALLYRYQWLSTNTFKVPTITGNDANLKKITQELFPEWGTVIATKMGTKVSPNTDFPKQKIIYGSVLCEDQGYKVLHRIPFIAPAKAGEKPKLPEGVYDIVWLNYSDLIKQ